MGFGEGVGMEIRLVGRVLAAVAAVVSAGCGAAEMAAATPSDATTRSDPPLIEEIGTNLPAGGKILAITRGDINADGRPDLAAAIDPTPGDNADSHQPRSLLLFVRSRDGSLMLAARNDRVVPCRACGGSLGEPAIHLDSKPGTVVLQTEGGTGWLWMNEYVFRYEGRNDWVLKSLSETAQSRGGAESTRRTLTTKDFGRVGFAEFDPASSAHDNQSGD